MADNHTVYKNGAKEIAHAHGYALSFMAKYDEREGNSCHIHCSLWDKDGTAFADGDGHQTDLFRRFLAGQLAGTRELTLLFAPNVNSYKRYAWGSFAPTTLAWGVDNRTCAFRVVGHGPGLRVESRLAGADTNPYLAFAAIIAAGLHGIENDLDLEDAYGGNAYDATDKPRVPSSLGTAIDLFEGSTLAREAFGAQVVDHYLHYARTELRSFEAAVTDWEKFRSFETAVGNTGERRRSGEGAVFAGATTVECMRSLARSARLARMRDALHQLAAALCAPLDLALTRKPREVLPLALAHGMAVVIDT